MDYENRTEDISDEELPGQPTQKKQYQLAPYKSPWPRRSPSVPIMRSLVHDNAVDALKGLLEVTAIMVEEKLQREMELKNNLTIDESMLLDTQALAMGKHISSLREHWSRLKSSQTLPPAWTPPVTPPISASPRLQS